MGQKVNQRIFKTTIWKYWFSKFSEKKKHETALLSLRDKEINEFIEQKFHQKRLSVKSVKIGHSEKQLNIFISYFKLSRPKVKKTRINTKTNKKTKTKKLRNQYHYRIKKNIARIARRKIKLQLKNINGYLRVKNRKIKHFIHKKFNLFRNYNKLKYFKQRTLIKNSNINFMHLKKSVRKNTKIRLNNLYNNFTQNQKLRYKRSFFIKNTNRVKPNVAHDLYVKLTKRNSKQYSSNKIVLKKFLADIYKHLKSLKKALLPSVSAKLLPLTEILEKNFADYENFHKRYKKRKMKVYKSTKTHFRKKKLRKLKKVKANRKLKQLQKARLKKLKRKIRKEIKKKKFYNRALYQTKRYQIFLEFVKLADYVLFFCKNNAEFLKSEETKSFYILNKIIKKLSTQQGIVTHFKATLNTIQKKSNNRNEKSSHTFTHEHVKTRINLLKRTETKTSNFLTGLFFKKSTNLKKINKKFERFLLKKRIMESKTFFTNSKDLFKSFQKNKRLKIKPVISCLRNNKSWELTNAKTTNVLVDELYQVLNRFLGKKVDIKITLNQIKAPQVILNQFKSGTKKSDYAKRQKKFLTKYNSGMWKYRRDPSLEEGFQTAFSSVTNQSSSLLLAKFIAKNLRRRRKHKYFLKLIKAQIVRFKKKERKKLKYMHADSKPRIKAIKIVIKGKLNNGRRKKKIIITMGKGVHMMRLTSQIDHSTVVSFGKKGTFGVKVWILLKKDKNKLDFLDKRRETLMQQPLLLKNKLKNSLLVKKNTKETTGISVKNDCQRRNKCLRFNTTKKCDKFKSCVKLNKLLKKIQLLKKQKQLEILQRLKKNRFTKKNWPKKKRGNFDYGRHNQQTQVQQGKNQIVKNFFWKELNQKKSFNNLKQSKKKF